MSLSNTYQPQQSIFKAIESSNFVQVSHDISQSRTLTSVSRGVIVLMLSMPNNWQFYKQWICDHFPDIGRDKMSKVIKELVMAGYIRKSTIRNKKGEITNIRWEVFASPQPVDNSTPPKTYKTGPNPSNPSDTKASKANKEEGNHRKTDLPSDGESAPTNKQIKKIKKDLPPSNSKNITEPVDQIWTDKTRKAPVTERKAPVTERKAPVTERKPPVTERKAPVTTRYQHKNEVEPRCNKNMSSHRPQPKFNVSQVEQGYRPPAAQNEFLNSMKSKVGLKNDKKNDSSESKGPT